jgi:hypothetical protein
MNEIAMKQVHDSGLPRAQKVIGMGYAWESNDGVVTATVDLMAWQTAYSRRSVQEITKELVAIGFLVPIGTAENGANSYRLDFDQLPAPAASPRPTLLLTPEQYEFFSGRSFDADYVPNDRLCAYCGIEDPRTKDHVIPKSRGGSDDPSNLVWACNRCNSKKGARTPEEAGMPIVFVEKSKVLR